MKIGIIGSGAVGQTLGTKWLELGHDVAIGTRDPSKIDEKKMMATSLREWRAQTQNRGKIVTFRRQARSATCWSTPRAAPCPSKRCVWQAPTRSAARS